MTAAARRAAPPPASPLVPAATLVLGIDPGSNITGYGLVRSSGSAVELVECGVLRPRGQIADRLVALYDGLRELIERVHPDEVAIEEPFTRVNAHSAFVLGKAQAVAVLAAAHAARPVHEYTPAEVKQAVTGYGRGDKAQVGEMIRLQFGLAAPPKPADAADALAVALCHLAHRRLAALQR